MMTKLEDQSISAAPAAMPVEPVRVPCPDCENKMQPGDRCAACGAIKAPAPPAPAVADGWTFADLQRAHTERQEEWCPDQKPDLSFRGNELGGECGEALNVIKKLERERHGWRGSRDTVEHLAEELADVIHCTVLVAITAGVDLQRAVIVKFNSTSQKNGLATMLATPPAPATPAEVERRPMLASVHNDDTGECDGLYVESYGLKKLRATVGEIERLQADNAILRERATAAEAALSEAKAENERLRAWGLDIQKGYIAANDRLKVAEEARQSMATAYQKYLDASALYNERLAIAKTKALGTMRVDEEWKSIDKARRTFDALCVEIARAALTTIKGGEK